MDDNLIVANAAARARLPRISRVEMRYLTPLELEVRADTIAAPHRAFATGVQSRGLGQGAPPSGSGSPSRCNGVNSDERVRLDGTKRLQRRDLLYVAVLGIQSPKLVFKRSSA